MLLPHIRRLLLLLLLAGVAGGCQLADPVVRADGGRAVGAGAGELAGSGGPGDPIGSVGDGVAAARGGGGIAARGLGDGTTLVRCTDVDVAAIDRLVGAQLAAFADGDFAAALGLATPAFRSTTTPRSFETLITEGFPVAASATGHLVLGCRAGGDVASATVLVSAGAGGQVLHYSLERLLDGWRIDGAAPLRGPGAGQVA